MPGTVNVMRISRVYTKNTLEIYIVIYILKVFRFSKVIKLLILKIL